jgi:hypothetical protein
MFIYCRYKFVAANQPTLYRVKIIFPLVSLNIHHIENAFESSLQVLKESYILNYTPNFVW